MKRILTFAAVLCCIAAAGQSTSTSGSSINLMALKTEIAANNKKFVTAVQNGDSVAIANNYHSDAKAYPPNSEVLDQRSGIASYFGAMKGMGIKSFNLTTTDVFGGPADVIETGTYEVSDGTKTIDKGKYIVIWRKENGQWKNYRDIWNSDMPPTPPSN
jgi:ketosteroid isomerase-like protein